MGIGFILAGMFFLFEPFVGVWDIFPDFTGYLFIIYGMSKISDIEVKLAGAKRHMSHALSVAVGRFCVMLISLVFKFDSTLVLVFVFSFAVLEVVFVLPAFTSFFDGMEYVTLRYSGGAILKKSENARKMSAVFFFTRAVCSVLPELTALKNEYGYVGPGNAGTSNARVMRLMLLILCAAIVLVIGAIWLSMVVNYLRVLRKNRGFVAFLREKYETEILPDEALHMRRSVKNFYHLWFAGFFFLFCISIDSYFLVPELVFGVFALFAFRAAGKYVKDHKKIKIYCISFICVMLAEYIFLFRYCEKLGVVLFPYEDAAFFAYYLPYLALAAAGYVLMAFICRAQTDTVKTLIAKCVGVRGTTDARRKEVDEARKAELTSRVEKLWKIECACAGVNIVCMAAMPWFALCWAVRSILNIVAVIYIYSVMHDIADEAEKAL